MIRNFLSKVFYINNYIGNKEKSKLNLTKKIVIFPIIWLQHKKKIEAANQKFAY